MIYHPAAFLGAAGSAKKGLHILTKNPVAIYAHIFAFKVSGASLLLPVATLGNSYTSINYTQRTDPSVKNPSAYSAFVVVATEDNTRIQVNPTYDLNDGHKAGVPFVVIMNTGDTYQGLSVADLTGSTITAVNATTGSCSKIAVFSGSTRLEISCNINFQTSDNLFQQVYPTVSWGKNFITVPLSGRNYDIFRIVVSDPGSGVDPKVQVNGTAIPFSNFGGGYYEFPSQQPNVITSGQPVQVVQYAVSERKHH